MPGPTEWEATFISGTRVLANKLGITDPDELNSVEHSFASERARRILSRRIIVDQTLDARHLRAIHYALFSPLYAWAGELRTYPLSKSGIPFAEAKEIRASRLSPGLLESDRRRVE